MTDRTYQIGETELRKLLATAWKCGWTTCRLHPVEDQVAERKSDIDEALASISERAQEAPAEAEAEAIAAEELKMLEAAWDAGYQCGSTSPSQIIIERSKDTTGIMLRFGAERGATPAPQPSEVERLKSELAAIDAVMARRPALDKPTRAENVEHAIVSAGRATDRVVVLERDCEDLGLVYVHRATGQHVAVSQVTGTHADWGVRPCPCVPQNQAIQRRYPKGRYGE